MQRGSVQEINPARSSDQRHSRGRKRQPLPLASFPGLHRSYRRSTNNFSGASLVPRPIPISDEPGNETIIQDSTKLFPPTDHRLYLLIWENPEEVVLLLTETVEYSLYCMSVISISTIPLSIPSSLNPSLLLSFLFFQSPSQHVYSIM